MNLLNFDIKSSWECENSKNLPSAIKTVEVFPENIFDSLSEDQCISFKQPIESPDCTITIKLIESNSNDLSTRLDNFEYEGKQTSDICTNGITDHSVTNSNTDMNPVSCYLDKMVILSEARFIELYCAEYSEYIATAHGSLLSEFDDSKIYQTTLTFNKLEKSIILKPKGLFCADSLWIYGIFLKVKRVSGKTNIENGAGNPLETILKEKNVVLSEKAEKFKKLLNVYKSFQSTNTYQPFIDPFSAASVFSNIHWAYSNQTEEKNFKFLPPKSILNNTSTLPKEEETSYLKSNSHEGGTMEKFLGKMQQLLLEESDLKTVNSSNFMKFISRNGNSSAMNTEHLSNSTEATDNFSYNSYLQVNGNNSDNQIAKSQPLSEDTISLINSIIDKKLKEFEENIVNKLETKIVEINRTIIERLDRIESKLS